MYKDDRGLYRKQVTINGKRKVFNGRTQREVMQKIAAYQAEQDAIKKDGVPFETVAVEWWDSVQENLQYNTLKGYKPAYSRAVEHFGKEKINDITPQEIAVYLASYSHLAQHTITNMLLVLRLILSYAQVNYGLTYNAASVVKPPKGTGKEAREYPSDEDVETVNQNTDAPFGLFMYATLWSGLRRGELCALQWRDIDWDAKTIHVTKSTYWTNDHVPHVKTPKTASGVRDVPLVDELAAKLKPLKGKKDDYVFGGAEPLHSYQVDKGVEKYRKETGLKVTPHGLRHGFASILFRLGLDVKEVQYLMGHAQASTTMEVYVHLMERDKTAKARDLLNAKLNTHDAHTQIQANAEK